jgi:UDP-N-acetylglucosamine 2-epimerase (non-hydrolysing)
MIHFVIGTRAQLFKTVPVMMECDRQNLQWRWIYTAQHKETIEQTQKTFHIKDPDYIVVKWDTEAKTMGKMSKWLLRMMGSLFRGKKILDGYTGKKSIVVTHGDTITTWWGALLGRLYRTRVMHVEAGLRSHKLFDPFPEEINRIITGWLSTIHICPDDESVKNLRHYRGTKVMTRFNTQADTIAFGLAHCDEDPYEIPSSKYAVVSLHRYENIFNKKRFIHIVDLLEEVSKKMELYMVLHPATKIQIDKFDLRPRLESIPGFHLIPRLEYLPFIKLIKGSEFVITDGGGNQEELFFMGKPTLLFRNSTERPDELGKTAMLSYLQEDKVNQFVDTYERYITNGLSADESPSRMIVEYLRPFSVATPAE